MDTFNRLIVSGLDTNLFRIISLVNVNIQAMKNLSIYLKNAPVNKGWARFLPKKTTETGNPVRHPGDEKRRVDEVKQMVPVLASKYAEEIKTHKMIVLDIEGPSSDVIEFLLLQVEDIIKMTKNFNYDLESISKLEKNEDFFSMSGELFNKYKDLASTLTDFMSTRLFNPSFGEYYQQTVRNNLRLLQTV
jgi:hypothetical protein